MTKTQYQQISLLLENIPVAKPQIIPSISGNISGNAPNNTSSTGLIAGIDEAGRGCFAGPVVAAAVILPKDCIIEGLDDSKKLSETRRNGLAAQITLRATAWSIGVIWPPVIDQINILQATFHAMARATSTLKKAPDTLYIDGPYAIPDKVLLNYCTSKSNVPKQLAIIDGDASVPCISAASILAKTFRDMLMVKLDRLYPAYGFAKHKGYGTREHRAVLKEFGSCKMHRFSFKGVPPLANFTPAPSRQGSLL